jgi:hypothetical protein
MMVVLAACKDETMVSDAPEPGNETYAAFLQFSTTGLTKPSWSYSSVIASYDPSTGVTTIETYDDSTMFGKFILSFTGGGPGKYRYAVTGSPTDTNQVDIWFAPLYSGTPTGVFELTGIPEDSLDATVSVNYFGGIGDSISGTMSASLKLAGSSPPFTAILYSGKFLVKRTAPPQGKPSTHARSGSDPFGFTRLTTQATGPRFKFNQSARSWTRGELCQNLKLLPQTTPIFDREGRAGALDEGG